MGLYDRLYGVVWVHMGLLGLGLHIACRVRKSLGTSLAAQGSPSHPETSRIPHSCTHHARAQFGCPIPVANDNLPALLASELTWNLSGGSLKTIVLVKGPPVRFHIDW